MTFDLVHGLDTLTIEVTQEDLDNSADRHSPQYCPVACAIMRSYELPQGSVSVGSRMILINDPADHYSPSLPWFLDDDGTMFVF